MRLRTDGGPLGASGQVADLSRVLVADEIVRARHERWSGVLALSQGEVSKGLYFLHGEIVFAASTVEEDRLGACLFRAGRISEAQFRAAMREVEASGRQLGHVLVASHVLSRQELTAALVAQVERIVLSVLRWTSGTLRRDAMSRPIAPDRALELNTNRLLLLGMRLFPDADRLERALGDPARRLRRVAAARFDYEQVEASPAERAALALSSRGAALADLLKLPHPRPQLARATYALLAGGLIELVPVARPAPAPAPPPARATPAPAAPAAPALQVVPAVPGVLPAEPPGLDEPAAWAAYAEPESAPERAGPRSPEEAEKLARGFLERGQRGRAIELLRQVVTDHPGARAPRRLLALTLSREAGFQEEVEQLFVELLESEPADSELRYALASYYRKGGFAGRAILQLRLVLSADSGHAAAWRDLGELESGPTRRR